jgi:radical SAM protein with 4Fe4S-binding SPASM domain
MRRRKIVSAPLFSQRTRMIARALSALPNGFYRRLMEHRFINFGVETTNICNADCSFCAYRHMERPKTVMKWPVYEKAIASFVENGGGSINFTPTVGDPLVDKHIIKKIRHARSHPSITSVMLYTNAILLNRFPSDDILTSGLTRLAISTYVGTREGYKRYYGKDKYERVLANIEAIATRNRELGSPVLITLHLRVSSEEGEWKATEEYKRFEALVGASNISFLESYDAWSGRIELGDLPAGCELADNLPVEDKKKSPCFELYRRVHVLADGNVGACICVDLESEIKIGNINEQPLQKIWQGEKLKQYRSEWTKGNLPEVCKTCTRYTPLDQFITENRKRILVDYLRRVIPWAFALRRRMLTSDADF